MGDLLKYTVPAHNALTSKITGELLEDVKFSKLGAEAPINRAGRSVSRIVTAISRISQEGIDYIEKDWREVSLDIAQLGLTLVGLIEVAEPVQMTADVTNGAIDIKWGHPIIGALSIFSATPLVGLLGGIPLTLLRAFKCVISGLKLIGKTFIAFAVKPAYAVGKFIWLRRGVLLNYSKKLGKFVENSTSKAIEDLPKVTESLIRQLKELGEKFAKEKAVPVNQSSIESVPSSLEMSLRTPFTHNAVEARKEIGKYIAFPKTYGNIMRPQL